MNTIMRMPRLSPINGVFERFLSEPFFADVPVIRGTDDDAFPLDVSEDATHVIVRSTLPGFGKENIEVSVQEGVVTINAKQEEQREDGNERYYRRERRVGSVSRRIALPTPVVEKEAHAEYRDGVLTLRLPKVKPVEPQRVRIN
jgi:HSP20 family protein